MDLKKYIGSDEVVTSGELLKRIGVNGSNPASVRQLVRRQAETQGVWRSERLVLPGGGRLFAHASFKTNENFIKKVLPLLDGFRPGLARMVRATIDEGVILRSRAELVLASPVVPDNSKYPFSGDDISALVEVGLGRFEATDSVLERITLDKNDYLTSHALAIKANARFIAETAITKILFDQFRRQNMVSWNLKALPDKAAGLVTFNNYLFSATGFSWLRPMVRLNRAEKPKPTPVVLDVYAKTCTVYDAESFIERIQRAGQNKTRRLTILGVIAAYDFSTEAWDKAKREGFIAINLRQHFGDAAFEALARIQEILKSIAGDPAKVENEDIKKLADVLEAIKGNPYVVEMRSFGLEAVSGLLLAAKGYENICLGLKVALKSGVERDVDVCGERDGKRELCLVECKAEAADKPLDVSYVEKFFTETVPAFLKAKSNGDLRECRAEIWTTGQVSVDAENALSKIALNPKVKAQLVGHTELKQLVPTQLSPCKRLLEAISVH